MTKVSTLKQDDRLSYGIKVETEKEDFVIPVVDVRDGDVARKRIANMTKSVNSRKGSKYMNPSFSVMGNCYQNSFKK